MLLAADRFETFGPTHLGLLVLLVVGVTVAVLVGRRQRGHVAGAATSRALAVVLVASALVGQVLQLTPSTYDVDTSLPLQLCDLSWMAAGWALWTRRDLPVALTYFWGLTLTLQAVLTPSLGEAFPDPRFVAFWVMHLLVVWSAVYLTVGLGLGPRWRGYLLTLAVTLVWAVVVFALNVAVGTNYGYLNRKPASASLFDLMGPWPVYLLVATGVLVVGWALMTWPWVRAGRR